MTAYSKNTNAKLNALGIYQLAGGLIGVAMVVRLIYNFPDWPPKYYLMICFVFMLYMYSVFCGILVLRKSNIALRHSLINQYLQLINFYIAGFGFTFISGSSLSVGVDLTNGFIVDFHFTLLSDFAIRLATDSPTIAIYINTIALAIIIFINNLNKKILAEREERMVADIGSMQTNI